MALIRDNFLFDVFLKHVISHIKKERKKKKKKMHVRITCYTDICQFNGLKLEKLSNPIWRKTLSLIRTRDKLGSTLANGYK